MAMFVESPWPILFVGIAVEGVLAMLLLQTGRGKFLIAMIGVAAVVVVGLIVERLVVTDREAVEHTLDAAVAAVRKNDVNGLLACIAPSAQNARGLSQWVLGRFEIEEGRISDLDIKVTRQTSPPSATAKFLAVGKARDRMGQVPYEGYMQHVAVELQLQGGRWLVTDYNLPDLPGGQIPHL
jgi:hypothetical protein